MSISTLKVFIRDKCVIGKSNWEVNGETGCSHVRRVHLSNRAWAGKYHLIWLIYINAEKNGLLENGCMAIVRTTALSALLCV